MSREELALHVENDPLGDFLAAYPVKSGVDEAREQWESLNPDQMLIDQIMSGLDSEKVYRSRMQKEGGHVPSWPLPGAWLRNRKWLASYDLPSTEKTDVFDGYGAYRLWVSPKPYVRTDRDERAYRAHIEIIKNKIRMAG